MNRCTNGTICSLWTSPDIDYDVYKRRSSEKLGHRRRRSKHADSCRVVSGWVRVSYITLAGSGGAAGGPQSAVGSPLCTDGHGLIVINWCLHALNMCSCHITLSAATCHLCDARCRYLPSISRLCVHHRRPHSPGRRQVSNRNALDGLVSSASPLHVGSRLQPATLRCSICHPTIHSPHPPPVTLYTGKTGEVQSRLIYDTSKRRHWRLSIIIAVIAPCTCIIQWWQGLWLTA